MAARRALSNAAAVAMLPPRLPAPERPPARQFANDLTKAETMHHTQDALEHCAIRAMDGGKGDVDGVCFDTAP